MKKAVLLLVTCLLLITCLSSQSSANDSLMRRRSNHLAIGMNINNFGKDFGIGINLTSPYLAHGSFAIRVSENYQWLSHIDVTGNNTWSGYHNIRVGLVGANFMLSHLIRLYGEGGITVLAGTDSFSSMNNLVGGYGLFGFEFYLHPGFSHFIELGGIGTGATADKVPGKPIYSNGFMASVGFRVSL